LLAAYLRQVELVDDVFVASISFRDNKSLHKVPSYLKELGNDVISAWNSLLDNVPTMQHVDLEDIVILMRQRVDNSLQGLLDYLEERYGL